MNGDSYLNLTRSPFLGALMTKAKTWDGSKTVWHAHTAGRRIYSGDFGDGHGLAINGRAVTCDECKNSNGLAQAGGVTRGVGYADPPLFPLNETIAAG